MFYLSGMVGNYKERCVDLFESEDGTCRVSTALVTDGDRPYETAFQHPAYNDGHMVIVESYDTKEDAQEGHNKWLKIMKEGPLPDKLVDCGNSGISQLCNAMGNSEFPKAKVN